MNERDLRAPTDETMDWLAKLPPGELVKVLMDAGRISHRPEDISMLAQLIHRIRFFARPEAVAKEAPLAWAVFVHDDLLGFDYFVFPDEEKAAAVASKDPKNVAVPLYRASAFAVSPPLHKEKP